MKKLSSEASQQAGNPFKPSVVIPQQTGPTMADSDSSVKQDIRNRYDDKIKLTGGN